MNTYFKLLRLFTRELVNHPLTWARIEALAAARLECKKLYRKEVEEIAAIATEA
jgi:hypothetical protein